MNYFDVIVIGSGGAGSSIALKCASSGLSTAIADYRPYGGTCAIRGCDPKKILFDAAYIADIKSRLPDLVSKNPEILWKDLISFKRKFTDVVPKRREESYTKAKIAMLKGRAYFDSPDSLIIKNEKFKASKIVIATGAKPRKLNIEGEELLISSDDFMEMSELPSDIAFIGGGFISFEFAHIARRFGSKVKIIHNDNFPLNMFDGEIVKMLVNYSREIGIDIILNSPVKKITKENGLLKIISNSKSFTSKLAVHGAGRVPDIDELNLDAANVEYKKGIIVNAFMQSTSNKNIYSAGDAAEGAPPLTPIASAEAKIAAENIIKGNHLKRDFNNIPSTLYTIPPLAGVGLSEENAIKKGLNFRKNFLDTSKWYNSKKSGFKGTGFKILIEKETDSIIGAFLLSPDAENTINIIALAMNEGAAASRLKDMIFTYPSISSDFKYMI